VEDYAACFDCRIFDSGGSILASDSMPPDFYGVGSAKCSPSFHAWGTKRSMRKPNRYLSLAGTDAPATALWSSGFGAVCWFAGFYFIVPVYFFLSGK